MTGSYAQLGAPSPLAPLVHEDRLGSAGGQATIGIAGIVLAIVLVLGQISLATSKGIAIHLQASVENITEGNRVMESVVERAAATVAMEKALASQAATLSNTQQAMAATNAELEQMAGSNAELAGTVDKMAATSADLATDVASIESSTSTVTDTLSTLPAATARTHKQLQTINSDTAAINAELQAIAKKMMQYGLPQAKGAPTG